MLQSFSCKASMNAVCFPVQWQNTENLQFLGGVYRGSANYIMITRRRSINVTEIIMVVSDKRHI